MKPEECPQFDRCGANLCPMDEQIGLRQWYPDEPVCRSQKFRDTPWILAQRRLAKKIGKVEEAGYFTVGMLMNLGYARSDTRGVNIDVSTPEETQIEAWKAHHKARGPAPAPTARQLAARAAFCEERRRMATGNSTPPPPPLDPGSHEAGVGQIPCTHTPLDGQTPSAAAPEEGGAP